MYVVCATAQGGQKIVSDRLELVIDSCKQQVLLTANPSLKSHGFYYLVGLLRIFCCVPGGWIEVFYKSRESWAISPGPQDSLFLIQSHFDN